MIALMNTSGLAVAIEPDMIESVEQLEDRDVCIVRTSSGKEHTIERSYTYVTGIIRNHYEPKPKTHAACRDFNPGVMR